MREHSKKLAFVLTACMAVAFCGLSFSYAHEPAHPIDQVTLKPGDVLTVLLDDSDQAFEISVRPVATAASQPAAAKKASAVYLDPPGTHRHVLTDGTIIAHEDWNHGDAAAHAGVTSWGGSTWTKYTGPLAPGQVKTTTVAVSDCPGGVCPLPGSTVVTSSSGSCPNCPQVATTYTTSAVASGYVTTYVTSRQTSRLFGWFRSWRSARLAARAARWGG